MIILNKEESSKMLFVIIIYKLMPFRKVGFVGVHLSKGLSLYNIVKHWNTSQFCISRKGKL